MSESASAIKLETVSVHTSCDLGGQESSRGSEVGDEEVPSTQTVSQEKGNAIIGPPGCDKLKTQNLNSHNEPSPPKAEAWRGISQTVRKYDDARVQDYKEDMDTLLVFTGLFSAVVTTFVVALYTSLQQDPQATTNLLLSQISQQLGGIPINSSSPNPLSAPFIADTSSIQIVGLWLSSLVCSLITSSLAILVKQWLREYLAHDSLSPQAYMRVRHYRNEGMIRYRVFEIASFLPLLMQGALALFFAGLVIFSFNLQVTIAKIVLVLITLWLAIFLGTTITPFFSTRSPFKTPLLHRTSEVVRHYLYWVFSHLIGPLYYRRELWGQVASWLCFPFELLSMMIVMAFVAILCLVWDAFGCFFSTPWTIGTSAFQKAYPLVDEKTLRNTDSDDTIVLAAADSVFMEDEFLEKIIQISSDSPRAFWSCIQIVHCYRFGTTDINPLYGDPILKLKFSALDVVDAYLSSVESMSPEDMANSNAKNLAELRSTMEYMYRDSDDLDGPHLLRIGELLSRMIQCHEDMAEFVLSLHEYFLSKLQGRIFHHVHITSVQGFSNVLGAASRSFDTSLDVHSYSSREAWSDKVDQVITLQRVFLLVTKTDIEIVKTSRAKFLDFQKLASHFVSSWFTGYPGFNRPWLHRRYSAVRKHLLGVDDIEGLDLSMVDHGLVDALGGLIDAVAREMEIEASG